MSTPIIELKDLTKKFNNVIAVNHINMSIQKGTIHGFLGPNGAGKTTTLRMILGLLKPHSGNITVFGKPIETNEREIKQRIGYLPGDVVLYEYYTVNQLLDYLESLRKIKRAPLRENLIKRLDVDENKTIKSLSRGNKQKVGLIQALMHDPDLLILDEPTSGLDPLLQIEFFKIMKEFKERDKTIFFSSHILSEIERVCDVVSIIKNGKIVATEKVNLLNEKLGRKIVIETNNKFNFDQFKSTNYKILNKMNNKITILTNNEELPETIKSLVAIKGIINYIIPEANIEDYFIQFYDAGES